MEFPILNRLGEIRTRLGPVMKELGLRPTIGSINRPSVVIIEKNARPGPVVISFQNTDGTIFSPVEIILGSRSPSGTLSLTWENSAMEIYPWDKFELGHNGWRYFDRLWLSRAETFTDDLDATFTAIETEMRRCDVVVRGGSFENHTDNALFAKAYEEIETVLTRLDDPKVMCRRDQGIESYNFDHPDGTSWRIAFEQKEAVLYVDGVKISSCPAKDASGVGDLIGKRMDDMDDIASYGS